MFVIYFSIFFALLKLHSFKDINLLIIIIQFILFKYFIYGRNLRLNVFGSVSWKYDFTCIMEHRVDD